jgi:hypothetical protein
MDSLLLALVFNRDIALKACSGFEKRNDAVGFGPWGRGGLIGGGGAQAGRV